MTGFTPEEWRTAARVARRSIFTEGNPDLADAWEKAAYQAEARLIPAGGMALTAEQVEDVRTALGLNSPNSLEQHHAGIRIRGLFPAGKKAEALDGHCDSCGTSLACCEAFGCCAEVRAAKACSPTPAAPAEEETKAGTADAMQRRFIAEIRSMNPDMVMSKRLDDLEAELNASSPVAPAPTETGPWQTWQEVPEGVVYTSSRTPWHRWKNVKGERRHKMAAFPESPWGMSGAHEQTMAERAPFVAAEEG